MEITLMKADEKASILDFMVNHARCLLDGKVKDMTNYHAENIIVARHDAETFLKTMEGAKKILFK